jgi:hypothetical protein
MNRLLLLGAMLLPIGVMGVTRVASLESRITVLDEFRRTAPQQSVRLEAELERVRAEVAALDARLSEPNVSSQDVALVRARVQELEGSVERAVEELSAQTTTVAELERWRTTSGTEMETQLAEIEEQVDNRWRGLAATANAAVSLAEETRGSLVALEDRVARGDESERWAKMVGPTVQLAGDTTVGSGVMLESRALDGDAGYETLIITSWHVVRDIRADALEENPPIPVTVYSPDGHSQKETATLLFHDVTLDAALLRLDSTDRYDGARLSAREHLAGRHIFNEIYAVGCPLGNDPIPTRGEIADLDHTVDGNSYWMISAPTYIGNSGGGIYDVATGELTGIFSKIYTHGSIRPTIVPHMGLVTPLAQIYDWLEGEGYAHLETTEDGVSARLVLTPKH